MWRSAFNALAAASGERAVDNAPLAKALVSGAALMGVRLDSASAEGLITYQEELLRWNRRVNLVGRASTPAQVMEKHLGLDQSEREQKFVELLSKVEH